MKKRLMIVAVLLFAYAASNAQKWEAKPGKFGLSKFAEDVDPKNPLPEYPRPNMVREQWQNLNGRWDFAVAEKSKTISEIKFDKKILVPFCMESPLSGIGKHLEEYSKENGKDLNYSTARFWYRRSFAVPRKWKGKRVKLNFGAVDWHAAVYVNGKMAGEHKGGYDAFSFDITKYLKPGRKQEIVVAAYDPIDSEPIVRGKQVRKQSYMFYMPVSGIWQTVWLEPVHESRITSLKLTPNIDDETLRCQVNVTDAAWNCRAKVTITDKEGREIAADEIGCNTESSFKIKGCKLWSPKSPYLYDIRVELLDPEAKTVRDAVSSYFGMRKIELKKHGRGFNRIFLNNEALLHNGVLDQGYWPDGIYTAPTDEALRYDLEMIKKMGFNMSRKHIKVEPQRWYYWADKLGVLVWQDMPSASPPRESGIYRSQFDAELEEMMTALYNHPSVVMWVLFNEGWGITEKLHDGKYNPAVGFDMEHVFGIAKKLDNTRLINVESGSGGMALQGMNVYDLGIGDVVDFHCYGTTNLPTPSFKRASVIGEYGYKKYKEMAPLYGPLVKRYNVSGVVWTQITDVEHEKNGLMTYDRKKVKEGLKTVQDLNKENYSE